MKVRDASKRAKHACEASRSTDGLARMLFPRALNKPQEGKPKPALGAKLIKSERLSFDRSAGTHVLQPNTRAGRQAKEFRITRPEIHIAKVAQHELQWREDLILGKRVLAFAKMFEFLG